MAVGVALAVEDTRLHEMCKSCDKADAKKDICTAILYPKSMWEKGMCWVRYKDTDEHESQFQQIRGPDPWEDPLAWLAATHPPSIRDREAILNIPAPAAKSGGSKSGRKKKNKKVTDLRAWLL